MSSESTPNDGYLPGNYESFSGKFALTALLVFVVILTAYIMMNCLNRCILGRDAVTRGLMYNMNSLRRSNHPQPIRPGIHPAVIATLPVVTYQKEDGPVECTVCLGQLEEGENVRMLPRCKHLFHVDCIDLWLYSHLTCPVCRANAEPGDSFRSPGSLPVVMAGLANAKEMGSTSIAEASFQQMMPRGFPQRSAHSADESVHDLERQ